MNPLFDTPASPRPSTSLKRRMWLAPALLLSVLCSPLTANAASGVDRSESGGQKVAATQIAAQDVGTTGSVEVDDGKTCNQSRKRLFVEDEGWIVRRVTTCY